MRRVQLSNRTMPRFNLSAPNRWPEQPRSQKSRAHARNGFVDHIEQRARRALAQRFDQLKIAHRDLIEHEMILWLEVNDVANVRGRGTLRLLRVAKTGAGCPDCLALSS
jgi:hypothetical protein